MIDIILSNSSQKPIYQQLFDQLSAQILSGDLSRNDSLPPIRTVAHELRISIITVKKAWELLEREGLIVTMVGRGSFVADLSGTQIKEKRDSMLFEKLQRDLRHYHTMGMSCEEIREAVEQFCSRLEIAQDDS
jgi:GntR family transcriptional regulator